MQKLFISFILMLFSINIISAQYKEPPENIKRILEAELPPSHAFENFTTFSIKYSYDSLPPLSKLAEPYLPLAGVRLSPRLNAAVQNITFSSFSLTYHETGRSFIPDISLQGGARNFVLSPDNRNCALSIEAEAGIVLYIINIPERTHFEIPAVLVNDAFGNGGFYWIDNENLYISAIPENRGKAPEAPPVPSSPIIDECQGSEGLIVTYQNLLGNTHDIELFDYYFQVQPLIYNINKHAGKSIGKPGIYSSVSISPDAGYFLVTKIEKPYSYLFPYYFFPKTHEVWDTDGNLAYTVHKQPLMDNIPQGGVPEGPRDISWQPHHNAMLYWAEALDGGNPMNEAEYRDRIVRLPAPFDSMPREITRTVHRFSGIEWSEHKDLCIVREFDRDRVWMTASMHDISKNKTQVLFDMSLLDRYNHPGQLITTRTPRGETVFLHRNDNLYFNNSRGATPEGNLPFIGKYSISEKRMDILYRCGSGCFQQVLGFYGSGFERVLISSEKPDIQRNYFIVDLRTGEKKQVTFYKNPYPEITGIKKELVRYKRKDGLQLSGTLYYPPEYKPGNRLPLIINAYPREYTDMSVAEQVSASPSRFFSFIGASPLYMTLRGYAVLDGAAIPIVGSPETVNDTFIEQTVESVEAAVNYLNEKGIIDPGKIGITGHSYGAFMVATVLGNSSICSAGVARSGAYNRTLTPFGFQGERRTLWEARDFYVNISPFMYADRIKKPILLIHGERDSNSGTHLMQTERMFHAVKGTGGTARMVILPFEEHGYYAEESIKHVLAEMIEWFDRFVGREN